MHQRAPAEDRQITDIRLRGDGIELRPLLLSDAQQMLDLRVRNRDDFRPFEPRRDESFFSLTYHQESIRRGLETAAADSEYYFGIFDTATADLVGFMRLSAIVRGAGMSAMLGYMIDSGHWGRGIATEAVRLTIAFAFDELGLHRVQASIMPDNVGSIRVAEKNGMQLEGLARGLLRIDGEWRDHEIYALLNERWTEAG